MKVWLTGLGLALLCFFHVMAEGHEFDHKKNLGNWHVLGVGTDCESILKHKDDMKMVVATVSKTEDGNIKVATNLPMPQGCQKVEMVFKKREDGKFVHNCAWGMKVVDTLEMHDNYAIVTVHMGKNGKQCQMVTVYGRERHMIPEIEKKFRDTAKAKGITEEQIKMMPHEVACTESQ